MPKEQAVEAWERQPGETPQAFEAFQRYRDMGADRSVVKVAKAVGKSASLLDRWRGRWRWNERARAFDIQQDRARILASNAAIAQMAQRHATMGAWISNRAMKHIQARLNMGLDRDGNFILDEQGQPATEPIPVWEARQLVDLGIRLERQARGVAETPPVEVHVHGDSHLNMTLGGFVQANPAQIGPVMELIDRLLASAGESTTIPRGILAGTEEVVVDGEAEEVPAAEGGDG